MTKCTVSPPLAFAVVFVPLKLALTDYLLICICLNFKEIAFSVLSRLAYIITQGKVGWLLLPTWWTLLGVWVNTIR